MSKQKKNTKGKEGSNYDQTKVSDRRTQSTGKDNSRRDPRDERSRRNQDPATKYSQRNGRKVETYVGSQNDPGWYNRNQRFVSDTAQIPFSNQLGRPLEWDTDIISSNAVAGIARIDTVIGPGRAFTPSDAANIAATGVFQFIRKNLSTYASYAAADVMMYILGIDAIYSMYGYIMRCFGLAQAYSAYNLYYNREIIKGLYKFNDAAYAELINNMSTYRTRFNNLIYKASTLYLPTDFTLTARHAWLFMNVFMDSNTVKAQLYGHSPFLTYILDETTLDTGTALRPQNVPTNMEDLLNAFDRMIEKYRSSDSMLQIAADMRRAFEDRGSWQLAYLDELYVTVPVYSEEVLAQIENTTVLMGLIPPSENYPTTRPEESVWKTWWVTQNVDKNTITYLPLFSAGTAGENQVKKAYNGRRVLNFHTQDVNSDMILVGTRDMVFLRGVMNTADTGDEAQGVVLAGDKELLVPTSLGSDFVVNITYKSLGASQASGGMIQNNFNFTSKWSQFRHAPAYLIVNDSEADPEFTYIPLCAFDQYTMVDSSTIDKITNNVIMSMWSIPQLGAFDS